MKAPVDYMDDEQKRRGIGDFFFNPVAPLLIGILFCGAIYGFDILNPENVSWLLKGDALQAYTGWEFFRSTSWSLPVIGLSPNFGMEVSNSIVYTINMLNVCLLKVFARGVAHCVRILVRKGFAVIKHRPSQGVGRCNTAKSFYYLPTRYA